MQLENKISLTKAFEKDKELTMRFAKNKAGIEDINALAEQSKIPANFITVNLHLVRRIAQSL